MVLHSDYQMVRHNKVCSEPPPQWSWSVWAWPASVVRQVEHQGMSGTSWCWSDAGQLYFIIPLLTGLVVTEIQVLLRAYALTMLASGGKTFENLIAMIRARNDNTLTVRVLCNIIFCWTLFLESHINYPAGRWMTRLLCVQTSVWLIVSCVPITMVSPGPWHRRPWLKITVSNLMGKSAQRSFIGN